MSETKRTNRIKAYAGFIKLEHAVFSLPLVFAGALLHTGRWPSWRLLGLILLAAIGGRIMAMGLNRIIDAKIDARTSRTQDRELPSGIMRHGEAWFLVAAAGCLAKADNQPPSFLECHRGRTRQGRIGNAAGDLRHRRNGAW